MRLNALPLRFLDPRRLTGPIFDKELRVSSRKKRFYLMRSLYLLLLMLFMSLIWFEATRMFDSVLQSSQMAEASKLIVGFIMWFQFIAVQILAVIMCSTAINQEIYHRTLHVLMSTPVTSLQIVMGKLLSRLWQILILLAVSLPLLAMIRVFGGIPWEYILSTFCVTFSFVLFISTLTVLFSILFRRAYAVIIVTVITLSIIFGLFPFLMYIVIDSISHLPHKLEAVIRYCLCLSNPYIVMYLQTDILMGYSIRSSSTIWLYQSIILLALAAGLLLLSCILVRKAALRHLIPKLNRRQYKVPHRTSKGYWLYRPFFLHSIIKHTIGTGMVWKEFLHPVLGKFRKVVFVGLILLIAAFILSVFLALTMERLELFGVIIAGSVFGFLILAVLFTIIIPATYITSEKESGTWLILLTTCYSDGQILGGKIVGILRRVLIVWSPFLLMYYLASYFGDFTMMTFLAILQTMLVAVGFVTATGLYFSSRLRHTTAAVICNLSVALGLWGVIPGILSFIDEVLGGWGRYFMGIPVLDSDDILGIYWRMTPLGLISNIFDNAIDHPYYTRWDTSKFLAAYTVFYGLCIIVFLWRTKANLRKRIV